jgi:hypothetical protein
MNIDGSSYIQDFDKIRMDGLDFCRKVYLAFEKCVPDSELQPVSTTHKKNGNSQNKKLTEELMPLCVYVQEHYRFAHYLDVEWHAGNQRYDAIIYQRGWVTKSEQEPEQYFIELTTAQHPQQHLADELSLTGQGHYGPKSISPPTETRTANPDRNIISEAKCFDTPEMLTKTCRLIIEAINKKSKINYGSPTVLVVKLRPPSMILWDREWRKIVTEVSNVITRQESEHIRNKFISIFLCYPDKNLISSVHYPSNNETIDVD